jgi:MATE family multidrug resistance protein
MMLALAVGASEGLLMLLVRNVWGYAYSNEQEVAAYIARMMPVLAVSILFDGLQGVLSGSHCYVPEASPFADSEQ